MDNQTNLSKPKSKAPLFSKATLKRIHLRGVIRLMAYSFVVSSAVGTLAIRSAYGDFKESTLVVGRQLSEFGDLLGTSHRVRINGEPMYVASAMSPKSVTEVLDRFEKSCREHAGGLAEQFEKLPQSLKDSIGDEKGTAGVGIVRKQSQEDGMIACLAQKPGDDYSTLTTRLQAAITTGDLSQVGNLRYVYARKSEAGSHVVTVWTDGEFKFTNVIPMDGKEPPGTDPQNAPRPEDAVRLLSAEIEGAPYSVRIYDAGKSQAAILADYDKRMPEMGWKPAEAVKREVPNGRAFERDGVDMLVFANEEGDRTYVSMVEMKQ